MKRPSPLLACAGALALGAAVAACSSSAAVQQGPSDTLRAYSSALEHGRVDDAYRMLSDEAKRSMSLEAFRRAVTENPDDVLEIARALARPASDPVVTATLTVPNGEELTLVYEGGRWRIDGAAIDLYGQSTPRQALIGFLRAYDRKRYDVILRYVPDAEREGPGPALDEPPAPVAASLDGGAPVPASNAAPAGGGEKGARPAPPPLTAEKLRASWEGPQKELVGRMVQAIRAQLPTATIEETGDSAQMEYGAGGTISFIREHGVWKINF